MYIMHNDAAYHAHQSHYLTGERSWNMNEQNEQNRTEQNKTEQNRTEPNRTEHHRSYLVLLYRLKKHSYITKAFLDS